MDVKSGIGYECKHLYLVVEVGVLYTILHHCTGIFTPNVVCKYGVISQLQRHFTLFYTFTGESVKTGVNIFFFFYFYKNIICTILYIYYIQSA